MALGQLLMRPNLEVELSPLRAGQLKRRAVHGCKWNLKACSERGSVSMGEGGAGGVAGGVGAAWRAGRENWGGRRGGGWDGCEPGSGGVCCISIPLFSRQNVKIIPAIYLASTGISDPAFGSQSDLRYVPTL